MNKFNPKKKIHCPIQASRNSHNARFGKIMLARIFGKKIIKSGDYETITIHCLFGVDYLTHIKRKVL